MTAALLSLLISGSASAWVYVKLQDRTGRGNNKDAFIGAAACFVLGCIVVFSIVRMIVT